LRDRDVNADVDTVAGDVTPDDAEQRFHFFEIFSILEILIKMRK
jgi:hypothetical protein